MLSQPFAPVHMTHHSPPPTFLELQGTVQNDATTTSPPPSHGPQYVYSVEVFGNHLKTCNFGIYYILYKQMLWIVHLWENMEGHSLYCYTYYLERTINN